MRDLVFTYPFLDLEEIHKLPKRGIDLRFTNYPHEPLSVETTQWNSLPEFLEWYAKRAGAEPCKAPQNCTSSMEQAMFRLGTDYMPDWFARAVSAGVAVLHVEKGGDNDGDTNGTIDPFNELGRPLPTSCTIKVPGGVFLAEHGDLIVRFQNSTIRVYKAVPLMPVVCAK